MPLPRWGVCCGDPARHRLSGELSASGPLLWLPLGCAGPRLLPAHRPLLNVRPGHTGLPGGAPGQAEDPPLSPPGAEGAAEEPTPPGHACPQSAGGHGSLPLVCCAKLELKRGGEVRELLMQAAGGLQESRRRGSPKAEGGPPEVRRVAVQHPLCPPGRGQGGGSATEGDRGGAETGRSGTPQRAAPRLGPPDALP